jgi:hypothetical protein
MADGMVHQQHHDPINISMVSSPHGPETGDEFESFPSTHNAENEKEIFKKVLYPDDLFTEDGVYWADLPLAQQWKFNSKVDNEEASKELGQIWAMFKKDPLSPVGWYFRNAVLPGAGLGLEGYVSHTGFN